MAKDNFFEEKIKEMLQPGHLVIDIGGGLRARQGQGNRYDKTRQWALPLLERVNYNILDPVEDYEPDIVGDIHNLPFEDNSIDGIICIAVLEHVVDPLRAAREMHRVLKPGGRAFVYIPFLFYYHAEKGYYNDYWRFTKDGVELVLKDFACVEFGPTMGALETWVNLSPLGRRSSLRWVAKVLDKVLNKETTNNTRGYGVLVTK